MWIKFTGSVDAPSYHDLPCNWTDGVTRQVSKERGDYLCKTYPDSFQEVSASEAGTPETQTKPAAANEKTGEEGKKGGEKAQLDEKNKARGLGGK